MYWNNKTWFSYQTYKAEKTILQYEHSFSLKKVISYYYCAVLRLLDVHAVSKKLNVSIFYVQYRTIYVIGQSLVCFSWIDCFSNNPVLDKKVNEPILYMTWNMINTRNVMPNEGPIMIFITLLLFSRLNTSIDKNNFHEKAISYIMLLSIWSIVKNGFNSGAC